MRRKDQGKELLEMPVPSLRALILWVPIHRYLVRGLRTQWAALVVPEASRYFSVLATVSPCTEGRGGENESRTERMGNSKDDGDLRIKICFLKKRIFFLQSPIFTQEMFSYLCGFQKDKDAFLKGWFFKRCFIMEILKTFYGMETSIMSPHFSHCSSSKAIISPLIYLS